jgi:TetR/AcrR family transcriptional regulator
MAKRAAGATTSGRRLQRRMQHQDLSRRQLLDAAEEVFGRKGFHETTLKEVAELAEFSVGSVYSFFESKDDLFRQIFARRGDELLAEMEGVLASGAAPVEQLHRMADVEIGFFRAHPHFGRLSLRYANITRLAADTPVDVRIGSDYQRAMTLQAEVFSRGQESGALRTGDPEALSRLFSGLVLSYQTLDAAGTTSSEWYPLDAFHELVERAFAT